MYEALFLKCTSLYYKQLNESIFAIKAQNSLSVDVVDDRLFFSLLCIYQLHHASCSFGAVEAVPENLFLIASSCQVSVPLEGDFQTLNKFPYLLIFSQSYILACFNKMSNMLHQVVISIKLLKLWGLVSKRHSQVDNSFFV